MLRFHFFTCFFKTVLSKSNGIHDFTSAIWQSSTVNFSHNKCMHIHKNTLLIYPICFYSQVNAIKHFSALFYNSSLLIPSFLLPTCSLTFYQNFSQGHPWPSCCWIQRTTVIFYLKHLWYLTKVILFLSYSEQRFFKGFPSHSKPKCS